MDVYWFRRGFEAPLIFVPHLDVGRLVLSARATSFAQDPGVVADEASIHEVSLHVMGWVPIVVFDGPSVVPPELRSHTIWLRAYVKLSEGFFGAVRVYGGLLGRSLVVSMRCENDDVHGDVFGDS